MQWREYDSLYRNENVRDPLLDTTSHQPAMSTHLERGELQGHQDDPASHRAELLIPEVANSQGPKDRPPQMALTVTPNPYSNPIFFEQLAAGDGRRCIQFHSSSRKRVTLVQWVKGMREMGCTTYSGEEDAEVAGHWLRKVERVIDQMQIVRMSRSHKLVTLA